MSEQIDKERIKRIAKRILDAVVEEEEFTMYEVYIACGVAQYWLARERDGVEE